MKEFKSISTYESDKDLIKEAYSKAGECEVYETGTWQNIGNFHVDFVGDYVGDSLNAIPDNAEVRWEVMNAEVRWEVMNAEDYANTLPANCSGDAEDFVCEETGKVLIVQFYVSQED